MSAHALLAPSAMHRWGKCAGSVAAVVAAEIGDTSSTFAREGSAAHTLGERALTYEKPTTFWLGEIISIGYTNEHGNETYQDFTVDGDMCEFVQVYVDQVNREPGELLCEEQFDLSEVYGVDKQFGTGDAVKLDYENERLYVADLKFGRGVIVFAEDNDQMYSYGAGALKQYELLADWKTITVAVHQPRLNHYDEYTLTRAELEAWMVHAKGCAERAINLVESKPDIATIEKYKVPGESQCQWCPIKGDCNALAEWTHESVFADFVNLEDTSKVLTPRRPTSISDETIGVLVRRADIIESACREWRAEGKRRLESGIAIPGWKLVEGRAGKREWSSESKAKDIMAAARIKSDVMYTKKLVTLPAAEKLFKTKKPKIWVKLVALMQQKAGAPAMAEANDARPALVVADESQFEDVTNTSNDAKTDVSDLI